MLLAFFGSMVIDYNVIIIKIKKKYADKIK
jgi:hypothetical protein